MRQEIIIAAGFFPKIFSSAPAIEPRNKFPQLSAASASCENGSGNLLALVHISVPVVIISAYSAKPSLKAKESSCIPCVLNVPLLAAVGMAGALSKPRRSGGQKGTPEKIRPEGWGGPFSFFFFFSKTSLLFGFSLLFRF